MCKIRTNRKETWGDYNKIMIKKERKKETLGDNKWVSWQMERAGFSWSHHIDIVPASVLVSEL